MSPLCTTSCTGFGVPAVSRVPSADAIVSPALPADRGDALALLIGDGHGRCPVCGRSHLES